MMTIEEIEKRIQELQNSIAQSNTQLHQLIGYRQALLDQTPADAELPAEPSPED